MITQSAAWFQSHKRRKKQPPACVSVRCLLLKRQDWRGFLSKTRGPHPKLNCPTLVTALLEGRSGSPAGSEMPKWSSFNHGTSSNLFWCKLEQLLSRTDVRNHIADWIVMVSGLMPPGTYVGSHFALNSGQAAQRSHSQRWTCCFCVRVQLSSVPVKVFWDYFYGLEILLNLSGLHEFI